MPSSVRVNETINLPEPKDEREARLFFEIQTYLSALAKAINDLAEDVP